MKILSNGGGALDAVEAGVMVIEADEKNTSVGIGGAPDRDGRVTLDACIMAPDGSCGSVCALEHIVHPISVARKVMEKTPHVILVGDGALEFALAQGFKKENLLTEESRKAWEAWKKTSKYEPKINVELHDTIGMITIDQNGDIAGACSTSGLAYKMRGRVGDSPIIGAGLYVDNEIGGAAATGLGEAVIRAVGSFLVVELMRQGRSVHLVAFDGERLTQHRAQFAVVFDQQDAQAHRIALRVARAGMSASARPSSLMQRRPLAERAVGRAATTASSLPHAVSVMPLAAATGMTHDRAARPSTCTVQAPH